MGRDAAFGAPARMGAADVAVHLGKGCEAIHLVPFLALTFPDAGLDQEGDFLWRNLKTSVKGHAVWTKAVLQL